MSRNEKCFLTIWKRKRWKGREKTEKATFMGKGQAMGRKGGSVGREGKVKERERGRLGQL